MLNIHGYVKKISGSWEMAFTMVSVTAPNIIIMKRLCEKNERGIHESDDKLSTFALVHLNRSLSSGGRTHKQGMDVVWSTNLGKHIIVLYGIDFV